MVASYDPFDLFSVSLPGPRLTPPGVTWLGNSFSVVGNRFTNIRTIFSGLTLVAVQLVLTRHSFGFVSRKIAATHLHPGGANKMRTVKSTQANEMVKAGEWVGVGLG